MFSLIVSVWMLAQLYIDKDTILNCQPILGKALIVLHHAFQIYILFGGYLSDLRIHLAIVILSFTVHYMNNRLCPITVIHNKICGYEENRQLKTVLNKIEPDPKRVIYLYYVILLITASYDIFMITRNK